VEREYVRAVATYTASLDQLEIEAIGVADRLIAFALPLLQLQADPVGGAIYFLSPGLLAPPRRLVRLPESLDGAWFFSTRTAVLALDDLRADYVQGSSPAVLGLGEVDGRLLHVGLQHLLRHWSESPPVRRFRRHVLGGTLKAVRGIDDLRRIFSGEDASSLSEWDLRDASRGGVGVLAPIVQESPVRVGELVGICPDESGSWQLGIVRRAWRSGEEATFVGLETLSQRPILASVDDGRVRADVFLCDPVMRGEAVRIAAPANTLRPSVPLFVTSNGTVQKLKPLDSGMAGNGFELRVYQVL
jgi:hypothetical protein